MSFHLRRRRLKEYTRLKYIGKVGDIQKVRIRRKLRKIRILSRRLLLITI